MEANEIKLLCSGGKLPSLNQFVAIWRGRDPDILARDPKLYDCMIEASLKLGEPLLACDIIREASTYGERHELKRLHLQALTQCGAYHSAINLLYEL